MNSETLHKYLDKFTSQSSRRLIGYRCAMFMLIFEAGLISAVVFQACSFRAVDNGLLTLTGAGLATVSWLAKQIFYRPNENATNDIQSQSAIDETKG